MMNACRQLLLLLLCRIITVLLILLPAGPSMAYGDAQTHVKEMHYIDNNYKCYRPSQKGTMDPAYCNSSSEFNPNVIQDLMNKMESDWPSLLDSNSASLW